jgi:hypothetical protein
MQQPQVPLPAPAAGVPLVVLLPVPSAPAGVVGGAPPEQQRYSSHVAKVLLEVCGDMVNITFPWRKE